MASSLQISLVVVVVLFAVFNFGTGLECIVCKTETECAQNKTAACTSPNDHCLKIETSDNKIKEKKCGTKAECDDYKNCWACTEEKCNSSSNVMPSFMLMGIVSAFVAKRYM